MKFCEGGIGMKSFMAGIMFTVIVEGVAAVLVLANQVREEMR